MHLVAAQAGNRRLLRQFRPQQTPRTLGIHRRHQVAYAAFEVHAVAAQAIVHQQALVIVLVIQKQPPVGGAVRPALPLCELLPVAPAAALHQARDIARAQADRVAEPLPYVLHQAAQIPQMKTRIERGDLAVAGAAAYVAMAGRVPGIVVLADLVTARATGAGVVLVIEASGRQRQHHDRGRRQQAAAQHSALHTPRPFRPFTICSAARYAVAMMVNTGLNPPLFTCTLPSITYRLS